MLIHQPAAAALNTARNYFDSMKSISIEKKKGENIKKFRYKIK